MVNFPQTTVYGRYVCYVCIRIETGLGHPGQILSRSTRSDLLYKISVWLGFCIRSYLLIMASGIDQSDGLSMLDDDDGSISPQD